MAAKRIALVTGANKGIGYEIVKALLESSKSYHVYLGSRSLVRGRRAVKQLLDEYHGPNTVELVQLDLGDDKSIADAVSFVQAGPGYIDILLNNAGGSKTAFSYSTNSAADTDSSQASPKTLRGFEERLGCARALWGHTTSTWQAHTS